MFRQAADLGVLQLHLSGGEPASRRDLEELVAAAREAGLYTNLITSGIGLTEKRIGELDAAGLDHVQLSLQDTDAAMADRIGGYRGGFDRKMQVAGWLEAAGLPLTLNFVMHRHNMHQLARALEIAVELGARRIEIATVQYHGWAMQNRAALMPTSSRRRRPGGRSRRRASGCTARSSSTMSRPTTTRAIRSPAWAAGAAPGSTSRPRGWSCPATPRRPSRICSFDNVRDQRLADIWTDGAAFNAFRGTDWMKEPCRSCERKAIDFGGCRCQAMAIVGDAAATDPVCVKSPDHGNCRRWLATSPPKPSPPR